MMPILDIKNAAFSYPKHPVFEGINFRLHRGEVFCLLGPNGCGKTTLLDCLLGLRKLRSGSIRLDGRESRTLKPRETARILSYVPQHHARHFSYSVLDVILLGRAAYTPFYASPTQEDVLIAEKILSDMGLEQLKNRDYTTLSGGESQLVLIMRALAQETPVIVMDEPTAHLDFKNELIVLETLVTLVTRKKISIVMATHFPNHVFYLENNGIPVNVALMSSGGISRYGPPSDVLTRENIREVYHIHAEIFSCPLPGAGLPSSPEHALQAGTGSGRSRDKTRIGESGSLKHLVPLHIIKKGDV